MCINGGGGDGTQYPTIYYYVIFILFDIEFIIIIVMFL